MGNLKDMLPFNDFPNPYNSEQTDKIMETVDLKEQVIQGIREMPITTTIEDIMAYLYLLNEVKQGREAISQGNFLTQEQVEARFKEKWQV